MKKKCKICKKKKSSTEFGLIEVNHINRFHLLLPVYKFKNICDDCAKLIKKKED